MAFITYRVVGYSIYGEGHDMVRDYEREDDACRQIYEMIKEASSWKKIELIVADRFITYRSAVWKNPVERWEEDWTA